MDQTRYDRKCFVRLYNRIDLGKETGSVSILLALGWGRDWLVEVSLKNPSTHFSIPISGKMLRRGKRSWELHFSNSWSSTTHSLKLKEYELKNKDLIRCYVIEIKAYVVTWNRSSFRLSQQEEYFVKWWIWLQSRSGGAVSVTV